MTPTDLTAPIAGFFQAHNSGNTEEFTRLFTTDAIVSDESEDYRGDAIKSWIDEVISNYRPLHAEVTSVVSSGSQTVVIAQISGTFPGSPVELCYRFTIRDGKIAGLTIGD